MSEPLAATTNDVALAAFFANAGLAMVLAQKGVITTDEANLSYAVAASMCRGKGEDGAARLIENVCPSCVGLDVEAEAQRLGMTITR